MIKLVSKSPIQRFKLGEKIMLYRRGNQFIHSNGNEYWRGGSDWYYRPIGGTGMTKVDYSNKRFYSSTPKGAIANDFDTAKNYRQKNGYRMNSSGQWQSIDDTPTRERKTYSSDIKNIAPEKIVPQKDGRIIAKINGQWYNQKGQKVVNFGGGVKGKDDLQKSGKKNNLSAKKVTPVDNHYLKGFENREEEIAKLGGVRAVQKMLGFTEGNGLDGKWGRNTDEAYRVYQALKHNTSPELPTPEQLMSVVPTQQSVPVTPAVQPQTQPQGEPVGPASRSDIRYLIRDITGNNPYQYLGDQRRALRNYINGEDYDMEAIKAFGDLSRFAKYRRNNLFLKKGGLVSSNPVKRFKLQQGNKLPTAPKAEDRYKDSYKSWNWPQYKEVTAGSILFPGAKISQTIEGSDTTYRETPPRFPFVKVVSRTAKNSAKTINWRNLITGQTYPEVKRGNSLEYETLKRRFNTAWNLAK